MAENQAKPLPNWAFPGLFLAYFLFYAWDLGAIAKPVWDEIAYVPAARAFLLGLWPLPNPEHPPFAKQMIALSMKLFGDRPEAWRYFSVLSGAIANVSVLYLVDRLGKRRGVTLLTAACLLLDPLLIVHYRMAILEPPMAAAMMSALAIAVGIYQSRSWRPFRVVILGIVMGLGLASKWSIAAAFPSIFILVFSGLRREKATFGAYFLALLALSLLPWAVYFGSYALNGFSFRQSLEVLRFSLEFHRHFDRTLNIGSPWYEWLYSGQPLWYLHPALHNTKDQTLMAVGNLVLWISAQLLAIYGLWARRRSLEMWAIAAALVLQFSLFAFKPLNFMHYMVGILPLLYTLMGSGIAALFDRYGDRYRRILQVDFALLLLGASLVTWNYGPFLWGGRVTQESLSRLPNPFSSQAPQP
ncbi:MAG TPA: glycosyltransferase family 39 protein [bacterium]|nr:glycosyltransferase family 39 protein [bacterium]